ncbi:MAG: GEVED domain-containing protein [Sphingomonas sp.]|jgi:hypothetical protein
MCNSSLPDGRIVDWGKITISHHPRPIEQRRLRRLPQIPPAIFRWQRLLAALTALGTAVSGATAHAQATSCYDRTISELSFQNPVLISGVDLNVGATYQFSNVTSGVDALVQITATTNSSLATIDRDTGLTANFQPELAGANARSADFTITFVAAGTTTPVALDFIASGIDIDGDNAAIREYAEFSSGFVDYVLETPTNIAVNASTPSAAGNTRFEASTSANAPGIDETATGNIVSVIYTSRSSFNYHIGALGTGDILRMTSLSFNCPALSVPSLHPQVGQDFGDAPASYGNPVHDIVSGIQLGTTNTAEAAPYFSATASADSGDGGVATAAPLRPSRTVAVNIGVSGSNGLLQAWIDWNGDGDFADAGEQVAANVPDNGTGDTNGAAGTITLSIPVPANATLGQTFARYRWSTTANLSATATASNGEVEDYQGTIAGLAALSITKTSSIYDPVSAHLLAVPGNDVLYRVTVANGGSGPTDSDSLFVVDAIPTTVEFYNGDVDGSGPATGAVAFAQGGQDISFSPATDLRFSSQATPPTSFAACNYTPVSGYDANVRYICLNPKGELPAASATSNFYVEFRARIK